MAQFTVNTHRVRSVQELQVPGEVGRPVRRRREQGRRASRRTTEVVKHREGGDPSTHAQVAGVM